MSETVTVRVKKRKQHLAILDDGGLRRRAPHIERHDVLDTQAFSQVIGAHDSGRGPGLDDVDGEDDIDALIGGARIRF